LSQSLAFIIAVKAVPEKQMQHLPQFKTPNNSFSEHIQTKLAAGDALTHGIAEKRLNG
jgi:hypothetical protein